MDRYVLPGVILGLSVLGSVCLSMTYENFDLPNGRTWKVGIFRNNMSLPSDSTLPRGNVFVFDKDCNVTIVFHEIYRDLEVALCDQVDRMKANIRALLPAKNRLSQYFNDHCTTFRPRQSPVIRNYLGPVMLLVRESSTSVHIKDRNHLREDPTLTFNATYELRLKSKTGMTSHIDATMVEKHTPCETNGIPVLVARNGSYEYRCDCKYSTYGMNCEFGPLCPRNKQRELCSNRGNCTQRGDTRTCRCDSEDFHGINCIHYRFFTFNNCCSSNTEDCCHRLPTRIKCSCAVGFIQSKRGDCVKDDRNGTSGSNKAAREASKISVIKSITSSQKSDILEMCCFACRPNVNFVFHKENHIITEVSADAQSDLLSFAVWKRNDMEVIKLNDRSALDSAMCLWIRNYSDDDFGLYGCTVQDGILNETQWHYLMNDIKYMEVVPRRLTVSKGDDVSLKCRIRGIPLFENNFNFNWTISPLASFESSTNEPYFFQGSNMVIKNVQSDLTVECYANEVTKDDVLSNFFFQTAHINVMSNESKYCDKDNVNGISWDIAKSEEQQEASCPMYYNGTCVRKCYINKSNAATWDLEDCSNCRNSHILDIFKSVRLYTKGITSYGKYSVNVLPKLISYLKTTKTILHGELGYVVKRLQETISILEFSCTFKSFNRVISLLVEQKHSIRDSDMHELEALIGMSGDIWKDETCTQKYYNDSNIISLTLKPIEGARKHFTNVFNLFPPPNMVDSKCKHIQADEATVNVEITNGFKARMLSLTVFKKPLNLIPFMKNVHNDSWDFPSTGNGSSALIQVGGFASNRSKISLDHIRISIEFNSCRISGDASQRDSPWGIGCARYLPRVGIWSASGCKLKTYADGRCSCSCHGSQGWTGLVCYKIENFTKGVYGESNIGNILGIGISLILLSITTLCLLYNVSRKGKEFLPRIVEVLSILLVNIIFLYQSLSEPRQSDNLAMLIVIASFLVLSMGVSVSHQVLTMQKCSIQNPLLDEETTEPSFLVIVLSFLSSAMLGVILWTISKVQQTKLTSPWLPSSDTSILSVVVLCYLYSLMFMLIAIAVCNFIKIRRTRLDEPQNFDGSIQVEFRNKCILNVIHLAFIFSSFYKDQPTGRWLFSLTILIQSASLFLFYTSEKLWHLQPAKCGACCYISKTMNLPFSLRNCWHHICTPYSGVAKNEEANHCEYVHDSGDNSATVNTISDISNINSEPLSLNAVSHKLNNPLYNCAVEEISVSSPARTQMNSSERFKNKNYLVAGSGNFCTVQYELSQISNGETSRSLRGRECLNSPIDGVTSLGSNSSRNSGSRGKISAGTSTDKSLLKISSSSHSKNENFCQFTLKNKSILSRVSSKFSLPAGKGKLFGKMEDSCWRVASSENFVPNHVQKTTCEDGAPNAFRKQFPYKDSLCGHRRQHSF